MIKIFIYNIASLSDSNIERVIDILPFGESEKQRLLNIKNKDRASSSLCALLALRELIGEDRAADISRSKNGKPYFKENCIKFNLSHSLCLAVAAVDDSSKNELGIDIEFERDTIDFQKTAKRFFDISRISKQDFFKRWTKIEAYSKMLGTPLADSFSKKLPDNIMRQFKIDLDGQSAYLCVCSNALSEGAKVNILHNCKNISIKEE